MNTFEDFLQLLCLGKLACHLPNSPSSDDGGWPSAPTMRESKRAISCVLSEISLILSQPQRSTLLGVRVSKFHLGQFSYNIRKRLRSTVGNSVL